MAIRIPKTKSSTSKKTPNTGAGSPIAAKNPGTKTVPNTPTQWYMDSTAVKKACAKDNKAIEDNCKPENEEEKKKRLKAKKGGIAGMLGKIAPPKGSPNSKPGASWIGDHCDFLMVKPTDPTEIFKQVEGLPAKIVNDLGKKAIEEGIEKAKQKVVEKIEKKVAEILLKKGAVKLATRVASAFTGPFAIVINVAMTAYDLYDAKATYEDVAKQFEDEYRQIKTQLDELTDINKQIKEVEDVLNGDQYRNKDGSISPEKVASDIMAAAAETNPCISARRCRLVPYSETSQAPGKNNGKGCCPGQTGHHILPEAMFDGCPGYTKSVHNKAPTLCVEGAKNWAGSHKRVHDAIRDRLGDLKSADRTPIPEGAPITKDQAIDAGAQSVQKTFPHSGCDPECIKAQLREYYKNLNCTPKSASGASGGGNKTGDGTTR